MPDRKLASIQTISSIRPIPGADKIELARVLGWDVVIRKGEFAEGQTATYVEIDSQLPERPEYEFLRPRKFRVRTIKLRGVYSQGLLLPAVPGRAVGDDVSEALGVTKYDPQAAAERAEVEARTPRWWKPLMRFRVFRWVHHVLTHKDKGWPEFVVKTDETRIQAIPNVLTDGQNRAPYYMTEKLDGCSATYYMVGGILGIGCRFGVCSRNVGLPPGDNVYWRVAKDLGIREKMRFLFQRLGPCYVQGEIIGPKIQGNKYRLDSLDFRVFNVVKISYGRMHYGIMVQHATVCGFDLVPVLDYHCRMPKTIEDAVSMSIGDSRLCEGVRREGIVIRSHDQAVSFKVINPEFLVEHEQ